MPLRPARGLNDLLAVANTIHGRDGHFPLVARLDLAAGEVHDHLDGASQTRAFLAQQGVAVPSGLIASRHLAALRAIRKAVRTLAAGGLREYRHQTAALLASLSFRLRADGEVVAPRRGWGGFVAELVVALVTVQDVGERLKRCGNEDCRWIYVDGSKNRSRQWCERQTCGNRANLRRWRARRRASAGEPA
jgi:predicted RNA-binding Zn ribbon-like protein